MGHRVASISDAAVGAILKLCTAVPNHVSVSLAAADNFNFTSDTTGKLVYVNMRVAQKVRQKHNPCIIKNINIRENLIGFFNLLSKKFNIIWKPSKITNTFL